MRISHDEIKKTAVLARLAMSDEDVSNMAGQLDRILGYIDKLNELDTTGVKPANHAIDIHNALREDEVEPSLTQDEALANAPRQNGEAFVVPKVVG
ncbi:Aspartyl-tRNA(Asn) amidotransferase subunit C @ Glutamyl-tRNA(Gln) amidotransferase subunit C [hydrothermal vent metagenome]|uniref:Aspartyl-tRNA(Asn) amidotransferase subunit C @ Glutamyl-tRNA(Gln) amidotransferase subunit C n=1 Tax=hydrothermal vent metagenome TaxID=652676 RepID=A0A3B0VMX1_9ZZZZ